MASLQTSPAISLANSLAMAYFQHATNTVKPLAFSAIAVDAMALSELAVSYSTLLASRNERSTLALIAKFTFCGMSPR